MGTINSTAASAARSSVRTPYVVHHERALVGAQGADGNDATLERVQVACAARGGAPVGTRARMFKLFEHGVHHLSTHLSHLYSSHYPQVLMAAVDKLMLCNACSTACAFADGSDYHCCQQHIHDASRSRHVNRHDNGAPQRVVGAKYWPGFTHISEKTKKLSSRNVACMCSHAVLFCRAGVLCLASILLSRRVGAAE